MEGKFITFEGIDGSGKTSVLKGVIEHLNDKRIDNYIWTREPGGNRISEAIRKIILNVEYTEMDARTEALLYAAARRQHLVDTVLPALNEGKLVLCDRFVDSSISYQGYGRGLQVEDVININNWILESIKPDIIFYLQLDPQLGIKRILEQRSDENNRLDQEALSFHQKVKQGFDETLLKKDNVYVIDASQTPEQILAEAIKVIDSYVKRD